MTLLSYIPLLLVENPKNVLVICFGTGQTAGAAGAYPGINLVDVRRHLPWSVSGREVF